MQLLPWGDQLNLQVEKKQEIQFKDSTLAEAVWQEETPERGAYIPVLYIILYCS